MNDEEKKREAHADLLPTFAEYGEALFLAQHLEDGLRLLRKLPGKSKQGDTRSDSTDPSLAASPETLRPLLEDVMQREYFTDAEKAILRSAVKERNYLVHKCWNDFAKVMGSPAGRAWIEDSISKRKDLFRRAISCVNAPLNERLKKAGTTLELIMAEGLEQWETGFEPPPDNLH